MPCRARLAALVCVSLLILADVSGPAAQAPHRKLLADKFRRDLQQAADAAPGILGLSIIDLTNAERFGINEDLAFPQGSAIKIPILIPVAWKPGGLEGVQTAWALVNIPGARYAVAVMINYGSDDLNPIIRNLSAVTYRYFTRIARTTPHGTRVPMEDLK